MRYVHHHESPLGGITLASDGEALCGLWFDGQRHFGSTLGDQPEKRELPVFGDADRWLDLYFGGVNPGFTPPLHLIGSDFQRRVWEALLQIPYGQTRTYGEIAQQVAEERGTGRTSARAVGSAVARNPISLVIPCHRVVGTNGSLTGYAGGVGRKVRLLELEGADLSGLFVPGEGTAV